MWLTPSKCTSHGWGSLRSSIPIQPYDDGTSLKPRYKKFEHKTPPKQQVWAHLIPKAWPQRYHYWRGFPWVKMPAPSWHFLRVETLLGASHIQKGINSCCANHILYPYADKHGFWLPSQANESFYLPLNTRDWMNFIENTLSSHLLPPPLSSNWGAVAFYQVHCLETSFPQLFSGSCLL